MSTKADTDSYSYFNVQLGAKIDNCVEHSSLASEKILHLRNGNDSHMTEYYVRDVANTNDCAYQLDRTSEKNVASERL